MEVKLAFMGTKLDPNGQPVPFNRYLVKTSGTNSPNYTSTKIIALSSTAVLPNPNELLTKGACEKAIEEAVLHLKNIPANQGLALKFDM